MGPQSRSSAPASPPIPPVDLPRPSSDQRTLRTRANRLLLGLRSPRRPPHLAERSQRSATSSSACRRSANERRPLRPRPCRSPRRCCPLRLAIRFVPRIAGDRRPVRAVLPSAGIDPCGQQDSDFWGLVVGRLEGQDGESGSVELLPDVVVDGTTRLSSAGRRAG